MNHIRVFIDRIPFHQNISRDLISIANLSAVFLDGHNLTSKIYPNNNTSKEIFQSCRLLLQANHVDVCAVPFHFSLRDGKIMDFITPYLFYSPYASAIIGKEDGGFFSWGNYLKFSHAMEMEIWIAFFLTVFVLAGLGVMKTKLVSRKIVNFTGEYLKSLEKIIRIPLAQDIQVSPFENCFFTKSMMVVWGIFSAVLVQTFSGAIMSATTLSSGYTPPFYDLEGMAAHVRKNDETAKKFLHIPEL